MLEPTDPAAVPGSGRGPPPAGSTLIIAAQGGSVTSGDATLTFGPGSLPADAYVSIAAITVTVPGTSTPVLAYDLLAVDTATGTKIEHFNSPPVLTVAGAKPGSQIFYVPPTGALVPITTGYAGAAVSAGLPHFSTYVVLGGVWNITLTDPTTENITLRVDNSSLVLVQNDTIVETAPLSGLTGVSISSAQAVNLTLDLAGGSIPVPITFTGASGFTNSLSIPALTGDSSWTWTGTILTGTSSVGDFPTVTAIGVQQLILDPSAGNTLTGPGSASTWTIDGSLAGSVGGLSFGGVSKLVGSGSDTLLTGVTSVASSGGAGTALGVSFSGMPTVTTSFHAASFSYQAPDGANAIELSSVSGSTLQLVDVNTVTDPTTQLKTVTTTTIQFAAPTSSILIAGDPINANTVTIDPSLPFTGTISVQAGAGDTVVSGGAVTLTLIAPPSLQNTSSTRDATVAVSGSELVIGVDHNQTLIPRAPLTSLTITSSDTNDDNITVDAIGGPIPVPITIDGGGGVNSLSLQGLTAGSNWTYDGASGTATSVGGANFHPIAFTDIASVAADGPGPNVLAGPTTTATGTVSTTVSGAGQTLSGSGATLTVASTSGFGSSSGTFTIDGGGVTGTCSYSGSTGTSFTGVAGCSGTPINGADVTSSQSSWTITGTRAGSVEGLDFSGFDSIVGAGSDTLTAPTPAASGSVLGISYTGIATTTVGAVDTFIWQAPAGNNVITLADSGTGIGITDVNPAVNNGNPTTLQVLVPSTELVIETGDGSNTVTIGALSFTGQLTLIGGSGVNTLTGPQSPTTWKLMGAGSGSGGPASSQPLSWASTPTQIDTHPLTAVSCATSTLCVAGDNHGDLLTTTNPSGAWTTLAAIDGTHPITGVSCTPSLCVAVDNAGNALISSDITSWTVTVIDATHALTGVSCSPDGAVCVAIDNAGDVIASANPTGGTTAWAIANVDRTTTLTGVSCASSALCVAVDTAGQALTSTSPTGGAVAWQAFTIDPQAPLTSVSCTVDELCVAADTAGSVIASQDPAAGLSAWTGTKIDVGTVTVLGTVMPVPNPIDAISCVGGLCVAGDITGQALESNDPAAAGWAASQLPLGAITGVACPSAQLCVAVDAHGNLLTATAPPSTGFGGAIAFSGFGTLVSRGGADTLVGAYADSTTWTITDPTTGTGMVAETINAVSSPEISFSGIGTLIGGLGAPGDNTISDATAAAWGITGENNGTVTALGASQGLTFIDFDILVASGTGGDTLAGPSSGVNWTLLDTGGFSVAGFTVTGIAAITGAGSAATTGDTVAGPAGISTWTVAADGSVSIHTVNGVYAFSDVATLDSGPAGDTLVGPAAGGSTWTIDGNGSGQLALAGSGGPLNFVGFKTLTGSGTDTLDAPGWTGGAGGSGTVAGATFAGMSTITATAAPIFTYTGASAGGDAITITTVSGGANGIQFEIDGLFGTTLLSGPGNSSSI